MAVKDQRIAGWADKIMAAIKEDQERGIVPPWVFSFAQLHDYTDANMYVLDAMHDDFPPPDEDQEASDAETDAANAVMDEVDQRLRLARPGGFCRTCGSEIGPWDTCGCWVMVAGCLEQYLGMDFDTSADAAARMWDEANKRYVWSGEYAADHTIGGGPVKVYDPPAGLAALAEQDAQAYPHDEPCPRCGRRQWGTWVTGPAGPSDAEQETCGYCGYHWEGD